jgi:hypothetical protein
MVTVRNAYRITVRTSEGKKKQSGDLGVDGKITLFENGCLIGTDDRRLDSSGSGLGPWRAL